MLDVLVLISGSGSNLQALAEATRSPDYPARIVAVGSDTNASGLDHARARDIPTFIVEPDHFATRDAWADELRAHVEAWQPGLVVCAGFMRILPPNFVRAFSPRLINLHPALLPRYPGAHAVRDAIADRAIVTGSTIHVVDEGVDTGPVIVQREVRIEPTDDEVSLHEKIKAIERPLLVETVARIARGDINLKELSFA